ncbi:putative transposase [Maricaulis salignorans]|uniref:Putative transposase n=1 Tax=Maricaulis salignorans TaxID=144026 RepID=A0A1G9LRC3_9PROT|nr:putative transposase [Maricaulis salignorans]
MGNFRSFETLQRFVSAQSSVHNHSSHERHLNRRETFKQNRSAALAEWRQLPV